MLVPSRIGTAKRSALALAVALAVAGLLWLLVPPQPPSGGAASAPRRYSTASEMGPVTDLIRVPDRVAQTYQIPVRVVDAESDEPLKDALVSILVEDNRSGVRTSTDGHATLPLPGPEDYTIETSLAGYCTNRQTVSAERARGTTLTIALDPHARRIFGAVVDASGVPCPGFTVCAWPANTAHWPDLYSEVHGDGLDTVLSGATNSSGLFDIPIPEHIGTTIWAVTAAGSGFVVREPKRFSIANPQTGLHLHALPLYGAILAEREASNAELRASPHIVSPGSVNHKISTKSAKRLGSNCDALGILGVTRDALQGNGRRRRPALYGLTSKGPPPLSIGPLEYRYRVPGYHPIDIAVELPRVTSGPLTEIDLLCTPTTSKWTDLLVIISGESTGEEGAPRLPEAILTLRGAEDFGESFSIALPSLEPGTFDVGLVPSGDYEVTWSSGGGLYACESLNDCAPRANIYGHSASIVVDTTPLSSVTVEVFEQEREYGGPLFAMLEQQGSGQQARMSWLSAPFCVRGVPPGDYRVLVARPGVEVEGEANVTLERGRSARVLVAVEDH